MLISPASLCNSSQPQPVQVNATFSSENDFKDAAWRVALVSGANQVANTKAVVLADVDRCLERDQAAGQLHGAAYRVRIRVEFQPEAAGIMSVILTAFRRTDTPPSADSCIACAVAPLLVAPNSMVQHEMSDLYKTMEAAVMQQLQDQQSLGHSTVATLNTQGTDTASQLTWSSHYGLLLWDMHTILACTSTSAGGLPPTAVAGVVTRVLEFLSHHSCWCTISWLLAGALKAKLMQHARPAASARLQGTKALTSIGGWATSRSTSSDDVRSNGPSADTRSTATTRGTTAPAGRLSRVRMVVTSASKASPTRTQCAAEDCSVVPSVTCAGSKGSTAACAFSSRPHTRKQGLCSCDPHADLSYSHQNDVNFPSESPKRYDSTSGSDDPADHPKSSRYWQAKGCCLPSGPARTAALVLIVAAAAAMVGSLLVPHLTAISGHLTPPAATAAAAADWTGFLFAGKLQSLPDVLLLSAQHGGVLLVSMALLLCVAFIAVWVCQGK